MRVLLDTTALYVAGGVSDLTFTPNVQRLFSDADTVRMISPISFTEIAIKANPNPKAHRQAHLRSGPHNTAVYRRPFVEALRTPQSS